MGLSQYTKKLFGISLNSHFCDNFSLYNRLNLKEDINTYFFDLSSNLNKLNNVINRIKPDIVFYLASQTLVLNSYKNPKYTLNNNINSLVNFLESIRKKKFLKNVIIFTSDKCYANSGKVLNENSPLGGDDPYSASKAAKEIIIHSYVKSFSKELPNIINLRAGNIIGGGDWNADRIIPDIFKSKLKGKKILLRNPSYSRPWQHVIIPIYTSLLIIKKIKNKKNYFESFNIGPNKNSFTVKEIIKYANTKFKLDFILDKNKQKKYLEKKTIKLSNKKVKNFLIKYDNIELNIKKTLDFTFDWYLKAFTRKKNNFDIKKFSLHQIKEILSTISSKV